MKKYKKKEMLETVSLLLSANDSITKSCSESSISNVVELLIECQNTALSLGTYLENMGGIGEKLVSILEDYCENVYQMSLNITNYNLLKKISKKIIKQLNNISNCVKYELQDDKKEIIFLPYKASMWDSLESIWMAAAQDDDCITYVIPIPYFDRSSDGTLSQMHYEGNKYPDYVPITSWQEYNIDQHKPDIAYVHNPYDDINLITCIHPQFFAKELKKHVDMLVYVPYFVSINEKVDPHFCITPVTIYADKIIVQSEKVQQTYIEELKKYKKQNDCQGFLENIDQKVLALGSPKYDKVKDFTLNELIISQNWRNVIYKMDGSRKRIVLYNTSIFNILNYNEKVIEKISNSLSVFKKYKNDIALVWRPHPLMLSTLQSMRPELLDSYRAIINQYKLDGWGIYDDTTDMNTAIALSDAYYGDGGSLLAVYEKTGKPILQQNILVDNLVDEQNIPIWPCSFCIENNIVWLVHGKMALLIKYDLEKKKTLETLIIPGDKIFGESLYINLFLYKKTLYMVPCWARDIVLYNIETNSFKNIKLKNIEQYKDKILFCKSFVVDDAIYCIPQEYAYVVKISFSNLSVEYINLKERLNIDKLNITDAAVAGVFVFCTYNFSNQIIQYNLITTEVNVINTKNLEQQYIYVRCHENKLYLYDRYNNCIEIRDFEYKLVKSINNLPYDGFKISIIESDFILLDDAYSTNITCIDEQGNNLDISLTNNKVLHKKALDYNYYHGLLEIHNGKKYYFNRNEYNLYEFMGNKEFKVYTLEFNFALESIIEGINDEFWNNQKYEENELLKLGIWLDNKPFNKKYIFNEENYGNKISQVIIGEVNRANSIL